MKRLFTLCLLVPNLFLGLLFMKQSGLYTIQAQSNGGFYPTTQPIIGPSPQATAITRYGDYPVNHNTGLVDMRVPLYTIKSGNLTLPIDISFHASGRMANEINGTLGMRWVLNAGGIVTRTVKGYPDEYRSFMTPYQEMIPTSSVPFDTLRRACYDGFMYYEDYTTDHNRTDSEYDVFKYVLPTGKSGQFFLKNQNGEKKVVTIPYEALKIELLKDNGNWHYVGIKITDTDGTIYNYGGTTELLLQYCEIKEVNLSGGVAGATAAWYLKSIVSADGKDTIEFDYFRGNFQFSEYGSRAIVKDRFRDINSDSWVDPFRPFIDPYYYFDPFGYNLFESLEQHQVQYEVGISVQGFDVPILKSVKFKDGVLDLYYSGLTPQTQTKLEYIALSGAINRKYKFNQSIDPLERDLRYLKSLEIFSFSDNIEKLEQKYSFDYYKPAEVYAISGAGSAPIQKDWWGYYNDNSVSTSQYPSDALLHRSIPYIVTTPGSTTEISKDIGFHNITREPSTEKIKFGMLKSISYPTGGVTEFEYENNNYEEYYFSTSTYGSKVGPGLRIRKVINRPVIGEEMIKTYRYGLNESGTGYINPALKPNKHNVLDLSKMIYWDVAYDHRLLYSNQQFGYRIRTYSCDPIINVEDFGGNIVWYDTVTEYSDENMVGNWFSQPFNDAKNGKTVFEYSKKYFDTKEFIINDTEYNINSVSHPKVFADPSGSWEGGKLIYKTTYKKNNGLFVPVLKETYNYTHTLFDEFWDMPTYLHILSENYRRRPEYSNTTTAHYFERKNYNESSCSVYGYGFRKYVSGSEKLASKTIEYFDGSGVNATTEYFYDPQYDQLKKEETTSSDGKQIRLEYEYPFDNMTSPTNNKMVQLNMIGTPISHSKYVGGVFSQSKRTSYSEPHPNVIRPEKEYFKKNSNAEEALISYNHYDDKGNPTELQMVNGTKIAYIWGYKQTQPVAKIENATQAQITALSLNMTLINDNATTDGNMQVELQKLRSGLPHAMVTTYTYKPLIGISTITDPKGDTVTYNYDAFGRLQNVKDKDGNILSENEYHYKN